MNIKQVFADLDEFVSYFKKGHDGRPPPVIRLHPEQDRLLKKWADERKTIFQDTVVVNDTGDIVRYKGIEVK